MSYVRTFVGKLFAVLWEETTLADIDRLRREIPEARKSAGGKLVYVSISDSRTPPPGEHERKALVKLAEDMMPNYEALYIVLRAEGFRGSVLRSAMAGMMLLSKHRKQVHIVGGLDEVLHAESTKLGVDETAARKALMADGLLLPRDLPGGTTEP